MPFIASVGFSLQRDLTDRGYAREPVVVVALLLLSLPLCQR